MPNAAATHATVILLAPEFASVTEDQIAPFLRLGLNYCSGARFGQEFQDGHGWITAHLMKMDPTLTAALAIPVGGAGAIASESHGPASISYAVASPASSADAFLNGSIYGQYFLGIRDRMRGRGSAVRVGNSTPQRS